MNEQEIRARHQAVTCATQVEFEEKIAAINIEQSQIVDPMTDKENQLKSKISKLRLERKKLDVLIQTIVVEYNELLEKKKPINRLFHELKHELIKKNPRELFAKKTIHEDYNDEGE